MNISREFGTRVMAIGVFIENRDMGSLVAEMQDRVQAKSNCLPGYYITWGGEFENQQRAMKRLALIVPVSVLLIFALLFNAFGSAKNAALILMNVPFALIGGIFALELTGIQPERIRSHRLHRAVWSGRSQRRRDGQLLQPASRRRHENVRRRAERRAGAA